MLEAPELSEAELRSIEVDRHEGYLTDAIKNTSLRGES